MLIFVGQYPGPCGGCDGALKRIVRGRTLCARDDSSYVAPDSRSDSATDRTALKFGDGSVDWSAPEIVAFYWSLR